MIKWLMNWGANSAIFPSWVTAKATIANNPARWQVPKMSAERASGASYEESPYKAMPIKMTLICKVRRLVRGKGFYVH